MIQRSRLGGKAFRFWRPRAFVLELTKSSERDDASVVVGVRPHCNLE